MTEDFPNEFTILDTFRRLRGLLCAHNRIAMDGDDSSRNEKEEQSKCVWLLDDSTPRRRFWCDWLRTLSKLNNSTLLVGAVVSGPRMRVAVLNIPRVRLLQLDSFAVSPELTQTQIPTNNMLDRSGGPRVT